MGVGCWTEVKINGNNNLALISLPAYGERSFFDSTSKIISTCGPYKVCVSNFMEIAMHVKPFVLEKCQQL
jgi:hypothetical protein